MAKCKGRLEIKTQWLNQMPIRGVFFIVCVCVCDAAKVLIRMVLLKCGEELWGINVVTAHGCSGSNSCFVKRRWGVKKADSESFETSIKQRPPLWSSGQSFWLQIQRSRVRFPVLPDFLSSSGSGTGSTQPREPPEVN
jgi:hypothetical protein